MRKHLIPIVFIASSAFQWIVELRITTGLISNLLTIFAIFFGFYMTSLAVFSTSPFLKTLYQIQDEKDNRKTLMHVFLKAFEKAAKVLLLSIIYLVALYIIIENNQSDTARWHLHFYPWSIDYWFFYPIHFTLGVLGVNLVYIFDSLSNFIRFIGQSAKE